MGFREALLQVDKLSVVLRERTILSDVTFSLHEGEILTLIGPNGAGKSTLVRAVLGLVPHQTGNVKIKQGIRIGYVPQRIHLHAFMPLSVKRFLQLVPDVSENVFKNIVQELSLEKILERPMRDISGGETQRVLLARALLRNPQILVLDEPVQGVDIIGQTELYQLIMNLRYKKRCGILMVSHDLHVVMAGTDQVLCLNHHICCSGSPEDVKQHPEFLNLFGTRASALAIYTHHHDHHHGLDGSTTSHDVEEHRGHD